jgi:hypothetical protein
MQRFLRWIFIAIPTFALGVFAFFLFWSTSTPSPNFAADVPAVETSGCTNSPSFPGKSREIRSLIKGKSGYFPKDDFSGKWDGRDASINDWYGKHLEAMAEGSLLDESGETETYRFLWLRTFHHPIYVRVESNPSGISLATGELNGAGGYEPGRMIRNQLFRLNQNEWCKFLALLEKADYWNLSTNHEHMGNDGAEWILEGVKANRYHAVDRWSPAKGEYREACIYLLTLSGINIDNLKDDLY